MTTDKPDLRYTPFVAHYTDEEGKQVPRHFATNAEAHAFRATLVDGKLPSELKAETKDEPKPETSELAKPDAKAPADPVKAAIGDKPASPPALPGMVEKAEPAPKEDANPPVSAAGRP